MRRPRRRHRPGPLIIWMQYGDFKRNDGVSLALNNLDVVWRNYMKLWCEPGSSKFGHGMAKFFCRHGP